LNKKKQKNEQFSRNRASVKPAFDSASPGFRSLAEKVTFNDRLSRRSLFGSNLWNLFWIVVYCTWSNLTVQTFHYYIASGHLWWKKRKTD